MPFALWPCRLRQDLADLTTVFPWEGGGETLSQAGPPEAPGGLQLTSQSSTSSAFCLPAPAPSLNAVPYPPCMEGRLTQFLPSHLPIPTSHHHLSLKATALPACTASSHFSPLSPLTSHNFSSLLPLPTTAHCMPFLCCTHAPFPYIQNQAPLPPLLFVLVILMVDWWTKTKENDRNELDISLPAIPCL